MTAAPLPVRVWISCQIFEGHPDCDDVAGGVRDKIATATWGLAKVEGGP
jgi:hypothetical protein